MKLIFILIALVLLTITSILIAIIRYNPPNPHLDFWVKDLLSTIEVYIKLGYCKEELYICASPYLIQLLRRNGKLETLDKPIYNMWYTVEGILLQEDYEVYSPIVATHKIEELPVRYYYEPTLVVEGEAEINGQSWVLRHYDPQFNTGLKDKNSNDIFVGNTITYAETEYYVVKNELNNLIYCVNPKTDAFIKLSRINQDATLVNYITNNITRVKQY